MQTYAVSAQQPVELGVTKPSSDITTSPAYIEQTNGTGFDAQRLVGLFSVSAFMNTASNSKGAGGKILPDAQCEREIVASDTTVAAMPPAAPKVTFRSATHCVHAQL
jgi:hypothetical protein